MDTISIYLTGVGGQGIGLLSEVLIRAADHAGLSVKGVDTHGLAQRGGIVVSHLKIGKILHSPLISKNQADMVIALERHEALRGVAGALRDGGVLVYYDTVWQPLEVRLGGADEISIQTLEDECRKRNINMIRIFSESLQDTRMQNMVVLAHINRLGLIAGIKTEHFKKALDDLLTGSVLEANLVLFDAESNRPSA